MICPEQICQDYNSLPSQSCQSLLNILQIHKFWDAVVVETLHSAHVLRRSEFESRRSLIFCKICVRKERKSGQGWLIQNSFITRLRLFVRTIFVASLSCHLNLPLLNLKDDLLDVAGILNGIPSLNKD